MNPTFACLVEGVWLGVGVAAELHFDGVAGALPLDEQIERAAARGVLAGDPGRRR